MLPAGSKAGTSGAVVLHPLTVNTGGPWGNSIISADPYGGAEQLICLNIALQAPL